MLTFVTLLNIHYYSIDGGRDDDCGTLIAIRINGRSMGDKR